MRRARRRRSTRSTIIVPFLLFPVRLETKFDHSGNQPRLRVRIFPDEVNVSTHDPLLSQSERDAGAAYWAERGTSCSAWRDGERRSAELGAWTLLATRYGGPRARYIARQTKPADWPPADPGQRAATCAEPPADDEPVRLSHSVAPPRPACCRTISSFSASTRTTRWWRAPSASRSRTLLMLGPDPEALEAELARDTAGRLEADPKLDWLINFERAVEVGMAVTMDVPAEQARTGFHRVVAIGAKLSMDPGGERRCRSRNCSPNIASPAESTCFGTARRPTTATACRRPSPPIFRRTKLWSSRKSTT